jgi:hypothetical protein
MICRFAFTGLSYHADQIGVTPPACVHPDGNRQVNRAATRAKHAELMNRTIATITAGAGFALAGLLVPATGASAAVAPASYSYATGFDSHSAGQTWLQENFLVQSQSLTDSTGSIENNHSLTETYVRDAAGNAFEFGITSDAQGSTTRPTLFTSTWTAGKFSGYEAGFVSTTSVRPGSFTPPVGASPQFGYSISGGKIWLSYGGKNFGYIPGSYWRGSFGAVSQTQTYGEVFNNSPGGATIPTMNGRISNYKTSTGSHLTSIGVSSPYRVTNVGGTGFTFSG